MLAVALLAVGGIAIVVSAYFGDRQTGSLRGSDRPVNAGARDMGDIQANNSPALARNPTRAGNLVVANRIDLQRFSCGLNVSFDGGARWSPTSIPIPKGEEPKCYAPDVTFAGDGTLYISYVTLRGRGNVPHAAWVVQSKDGGRTLSAPQRALGRLAFQVRLTADPERADRLYLTWVQASEVGLYRFTETGNPVRFARSDDGGSTWKRSVRVSTPSRARVLAPSAAVGADGEIYVVYLDLGQDTLDYEGAHQGFGGRPYGGRFELVMGRSVDGGATWEESSVERGLTAIERFLVFLPPSPAVAVDRNSGRVYAGFHEQRMGAADVLVWSLSRDGARWQGPTRVNDNPAGDKTSQYLPKLAVAPDGRLDVVYYDRRADRKNVLNEVSLQSSFDKGQSFTKRIRLSSRRFDSRVGFGFDRNLPDLGSRLALLSGESGALAAWSDTRNGTAVTNKQDIFKAEVAFPARLSEPVERGLLYGGITLGILGLALLASASRRRR